MSDHPTHRQFFGDGEHAFALTSELIIELERVTATGIGALCRRVFAGDFRHADLLSVIRLALIGGGVSPKDAAGLVAAYVEPRPLAETFPLAIAILETLWFGAAQTSPKSRKGART